jgi:hypothetical protein
MAWLLGMAFRLKGKAAQHCGMHCTAKKTHDQ